MKKLTYNQARAFAVEAGWNPQGVSRDDRKAALARLIEETRLDDNTRDESQKILKLARCLVFLPGATVAVDDGMAQDFYNAWLDTRLSPTTIAREPSL